MKITAVEALHPRLPEMRARTGGSQDALLIRIGTDAGIAGWGEVDGCPRMVEAVVEAPMSHTLAAGEATRSGARTAACGCPGSRAWASSPTWRWSRDVLSAAEPRP
jgi:L-alanine-DL-glutamate epimerase-like enolase superfamily enzyme